MGFYGWVLVNLIVVLITMEYPLVFSAMFTVII